MNSRLLSKSVVTTLAFALFATVSNAQTPVGFSKAFSPDTIGPGSTSTLTFAITNQTSSPATNIAFTDVLPAGVVIAAAPGAETDCPEAILTAPAGGTTIDFSDGRIAGLGSCFVSVNVTSSVLGTHNNVTGVLTSNAGPNGTASANLTVTDTLPGFSKSFSSTTIEPATIEFGDRSTLTFEIEAAGLVNNPSFIDQLPDGMVIADPANVSVANIGGSYTVTAVPGTSLITFFPAFSSSIAAATTATISVDVRGNNVGVLENVSEDLASNSGDNSGKASASLLVNPPARITLMKSFVADPAPAGGIVELKYSITNRDRSEDAINIAFTDNLGDAGGALLGLAVSSSPPNPCGGSISGTTNLSFSGGSLAAGESCEFSVLLDVPSATLSGGYPSTSGAVSADIGGDTEVGNAASDTLFVAPTITLTKSFTNDPVAVGGIVPANLEFTITNPNASVATDITFTDELTAILADSADASLPADGFCGPNSSMSIQVLETDFFNNPIRHGITVTRAEVAGQGGFCSFSLDIVVDPTLANGSYANTTSSVTATVNGATVVGNPATDSLAVVAPPSFSKAFLNDPVLAGGTVQLEFSLLLDENAPSDATGIGFTDNLGAVLTGLATTSGLSQSACGGSVSSVDGSIVSFTGGSLSPGDDCSFTIPVTVPAGTVSGSYTNTTGALTATVGGLTVTGLAASDELDVADLVLTKEFGKIVSGEFIDDPVVIAGGDVTLRFKLENNSLDPDLVANDIFFYDDLNGVLAGLVVGTIPDATPCGGTLTASSGNTLLTFSGGSLAADSACEFDVILNVPLGAPSDTYQNTTTISTGQFAEAGFRARIGEATASITLPAATDELVVSSDLLQLTKSFADDPVASGGTVTLDFMLSNIGSTPVTSISFTDDLGAVLPGLQAITLPAAGFCGAATLTGTNVLTFSQGSLGAGGNCSFSVTVQVPNVQQATTVINTTSSVSGLVGNLAVFGDPASDALNINSPVANAPNVTINQAAGQADPTNATPINFTVVFNQPVTGFTSGDVSLSSGTDTVSEIAPLDGTTYNVAVSGLSAGDCDLTATVPAGVARNAESTRNNASTSTDNTVKFDATPPVIALNGPAGASITLECGVDTYTEAGATATDNCDPAFPKPAIVGGDTVNPNQLGDYTVTYDATDFVGNVATQVTRTVTVEDTTPPVITLKEPIEQIIECPGFYEELGATAEDICDQDLGPVVIDASSITASLPNPPAPGTYTITYNVSDASGNAAAQVNRIVTVEDNVAPVLSFDPPNNADEVIVIRNETYTELGVDIFEECDQNIQLVIGGNTVNTAMIGVYLVTYDATDASGNAANQLTRTVKVVPRFASIEGVFGAANVKIGNSATVVGGPGFTDPVYAVGSQNALDLHNSVVITGSTITVEGSTNQDDVEVKNDVEITGNVDSGGDVVLKTDSSVGGDVTSGGDIDLKKDASIGGDATATGTVSLGNGASVAGTTTEGAPDPAFPDIALPVLALSAGGVDVTVPLNGSTTLGPDSYGALHLLGGSTLTLTGGTYAFESILADANSQIVINGPVTVNVEGDVLLESGVVISGEDSANILVQVQGSSVNLESGGAYLGTYLAPDASISLGSSASLTGALIGDSVHVKASASVTGKLALDLLLVAAADWSGFTVAQLVAGVSPEYYRWASEHGITGAPDDDADFDGISNVLEFILDLSPREASALPTPVFDTATNGISWSLPVRTDLQSLPFVTSVEISFDLLTWKPAGEAGLLEQLEEGMLRVSGPRSRRSLYLRLGLRNGDPIANPGEDGDNGQNPTGNQDGDVAPDGR